MATNFSINQFILEMDADSYPADHNSRLINDIVNSVLNGSKQGEGVWICR